MIAECWTILATTVNQREVVNPLIWLQNGIGLSAMG